MSSEKETVKLEKHLSYRLASPHVTYEEFDEEFVVLNLVSGRYFSFANGAALVWKGIVSGHSPAALGERLLADSPAVQAFDRFVTEIIESGLVVSVSDGTDAKGDIVDLPEKISRVGDDFKFESFDDLAALLVADPIHDVEEEAGWPHRPT